MAVSKWLVGKWERFWNFFFFQGQKCWRLPSNWCHIWKKFLKFLYAPPPDHCLTCPVSSLSMWKYGQKTTSDPKNIAAEKQKCRSDNSDVKNKNVFMVCVGYECFSKKGRNIWCMWVRYGGGPLKLNPAYNKDKGHQNIWLGKPSKC